MSHPRIAAAAAAALVLAAGLTACSSNSDAAKSDAPAPADNPSAPAGSQCAKLTVTDAWAKANKHGSTMTGVFGTLKNEGEKDVVLKDASSERAKKVEMHETVAQGGGMKMQAKEGGFVIKPGESLTLEPGKNHIMLMDMTSELLPGEKAVVTLRCSDGSSAPMAADVREFSGANEEYAGGHDGAKPTMTGTLPAGVDLPGQSPR